MPEYPYRSAVSLKLNAGMNTNGSIKRKSVSLGKIAWGATFAGVMDVIGALLPCLEYPLFLIERTQVTRLEN